MKAELIYKNKIVSENSICEMIIWKLSQKTNERPHGLKYRLFCGKNDGTCFVRYDNEKGKGDHRHYGKREESYNFIDIEQLISDFLDDIENIKGKSK